MTCAKQEVRAQLRTVGGKIFEGFNACTNPQEVCPRVEEGYESGEGYHLCQEVCQQTSHAEVAAIQAAGHQARGAVIYVTGHTYACDSCKQAADDAGVKRIEIGEAPLFRENQVVELLSGKYKGQEARIMHQSEPHPQNTKVPRYSVRTYGRNQGKTLVMSQNNLRSVNR